MPIFSDFAKRGKELVEGDNFGTKNVTQGIGAQFDLLKFLEDKVKNQSANVTAGIFGEEARFKRSIGTNIAAVGSDVGGTANRSQLFSAGGDFASRRMNARTAFEQARIMNLLGISGGFGSNASLANNFLTGQQNFGLQQNQQQFDQQFNIADLLSLFSVTKTF